MVAANRLCLTCGTEYSGFISVCPEDQTRLTVLSQDERVGTVLAERYDILEIIGTGGMGTVYKARQRLINRIVAVKMLHKTMMSSADVLRRFQLEAQAASRLSLPNILTIYDFGLTEEGQPYMVMDYLNGTSLDKIILAQHHLEPVRALNIFIQACAALAHAHMHEVLHRDIKPSNIMLVNFDDQSDFVKIVDFGIAKMMNKIEGQSAELTKTGEVYGSPPYMSPEQCRGLELDNRADIYSLACVLYKSLVGKNPMQTSGDSMPLQIMLKHINEKAPSFAEAAPELFLSSRLEAVVFKALEKSPDDRYQTMLEFKDALEKVREVLIAESKLSQQMKESATGEFELEDVAQLPETSGGNPVAAAPNASPKSRRQLVDDPTPHLPTATVPFDQQLSPAAAANTSWTEVSQSTIGTPKPPVPAAHNLSPSEFLSTLNSQLTQSAQAPSAQPAPQPVQSFAPGNGQSAHNSGQQQVAPQGQPIVQAPTSGGASSAVPQTAQSPASPLLNIANNSQSKEIQQPATAAAPSVSSADNGATKAAQPNQPVARATFAEALQAALPSPDTQMLSIVQTPNAQAATAKASQGNGAPSAESAPPTQDRRATKSQSHHSLPAQSAAPNAPAQAGQQPPVRAQMVSNMPPAPSSQLTVQQPVLNRQPSPLTPPGAPPAQNALPVQTAPVAQAAVPVNTSASSVATPDVRTPQNVQQPGNVSTPASALAVGQPAPSINLQQTVNKTSSPNVTINPTSSSRVRVSQTLNDLPKVDGTMPTLREAPALATDLPGTPVDSKIPASVLDGIKAPNVKSTKTNFEKANATKGSERAPQRSKSRRFEEPVEEDRSQRLSENRRKFIKHETDSSKTMLMVAGLAFIVILAAFFSFSYFNNLPKQAQAGSDATQTASTQNQRPQDTSSTALNTSAPGDAKQAPSTQAAKNTTAVGGTGGTTAGANITNEIASVAPAVAKPHKSRKVHAAAAATPAATTAPAAAGAGAGVRRHAYSSYGSSY